MLRVTLAAVGRLKAGPERELVSRYLGRAQALARQTGLSAVEAREVEESRARSAAERRRGEAGALLAGLPSGTPVVALDERGRSLDSTAFARLLARLRDEGQADLWVVVGGPDGLDDAVVERADHVVAYGSATFPHQLARVMAAEQIYRALTILSDHPYHRA